MPCRPFRSLCCDRLELCAARCATLVGAWLAEPAPLVLTLGPPLPAPRFTPKLPKLSPALSPITEQPTEQHEHVKALWLTYARKSAHAYECTHSHTHTRNRTRMHAHAHIHARTHTPHIHAHIRVRTHARTRTHAPKCTSTRMRTCACTRTHTRTRTHTCGNRSVEGLRRISSGSAMPAARLRNKRDSKPYEGGTAARATAHANARATVPLECLAPALPECSRPHRRSAAIYRPYHCVLLSHRTHCGTRPMRADHCAWTICAWMGPTGDCARAHGWLRRRVGCSVLDV